MAMDLDVPLAILQQADKVAEDAKGAQAVLGCDGPEHVGNVAALAQQREDAPGYQ